jgi:hypothetical protein
MPEMIAIFLLAQVVELVSVMTSLELAHPRPSAPLEPLAASARSANHS